MNRPRLSAAGCSALLMLALIVLTPTATAATPANLPGFDATTLSGSPLGDAALTGRVVLFDFWATWCKPCIAAIPHLKRLSDEHCDAPFALISVSTDWKEEPLRKVRRHGHRARDAAGV